MKIAGRAVSVCVVLLTIYLLLATFLRLRQYPRTDDASVRANVVAIAANVEGYVTEVAVVDNQPVRQGDLLMVIDQRPYEAAVAQARAAEAMVALQIQETRDKIAAAEAAILKARASREYAHRHLERLEPLLQRQFVTPDEVDKARAAAREMEAGVVQAEAELERQRNALGQIGDVNVRLAQARAAVVAAELNLEYCTIRSPVDGFVTNFNLSPGTHADAGEVLFAVVDSSRWFVMANFMETEIGLIRPDMEVTAYLMAYPTRPFKGVVQGIGWALQMPYEEDTGVLPKTDPTLDWVRLAQRFPVRVQMLEWDEDRPFRMGATASVIVHTAEMGVVPTWIEKTLPSWIRGLPLMPDRDPSGAVLDQR